MTYAYTNKALRFFAGLADAVGGIFFREKEITAGRNAPLKILVIKVDQLGDCFLSTPIFEYLRAVFPRASIDVVCQKSSMPIFEHNPFITRIIPFNYKRMHRGKHPAGFGDSLRFIKEIRRYKYDMVIDLRGEPFAALLGFLSGAQDRVGFEKEEIGGFFYTCRLCYDRNEHEIKRYERVIAALGGRTSAWEPRVYLTQEEEEQGRRLITPFAKQGYFIVHPGAGLIYKIWPKERFAEVVKKTLAEFSSNAVFLGGKDEREIGDSIARIVSDSRAYNMVGQFSIRESYIVISHAKAFLGNDSVLVHFAGALGVPTVVLTNAVVNEGRWRPLGRRVTVITGNGKNHICAFALCPYPCPNMQAIAIRDVYEKWRATLSA